MRNNIEESQAAQHALFVNRKNALTSLILSGTIFLLSGHASPAKERRSPLPTLPGYSSVPVRYSHWNKMLMEAVVNGHRARFVVDTGAGYSILDADRARALGVSPVGADSPYGEFANLNGVSYRVGYLNSLRAGTMDFGSGPMALFEPANSDAALDSRLNGENEDGILGADILTRYKAVINCYTKTIFFKTSSSEHLHVARFAESKHFVKVPLREEVSRAFTVPASINGHPCRLLVDTGAFVTTFDLRRAKEFGLSFTGTKMKGSFADGISRQVAIGHVANLRIGDYPVPPQKLAASMLPDFALEQGQAKIAGILGMELLAASHGIIDFDSMSLFLK
jgi:predicted aspartyl protease